METSMFCLWISATLSVQPDRSQFFRYETLSLHCEASGNASDWTVMRNTSSGSAGPCESWGESNGPSCIIKGTYHSDTGGYWCQSVRGECSNILSLTVNTATVILDSPAGPVTEGATVILRCLQKARYSKHSTSAFSSVFYKNGVFIGNYTEGKMILPSVSESDEALYKCQHPTEGQSPESLLAVTAEVSQKPAPPFMSVPRLLCSILLLIVYTLLLIVSMYVCQKWTRARAAARKV